MTGLDRLVAGEPEVRGLLKGRRIGLLAHAASVDAALHHVLPLMRSAGLSPAVLFGPEHGFAGAAQDMIGVGDAADTAGVPVYSLYGDSEAALSPSADQLRGLDVLVIDLQDVGSRYYTYVWTAVRALRAAAALGIQTVVLDRPNPLGGEVVEGRVQRPGYRSFVGHCDVSVRHGMTIGELCARVARLDGLSPSALQVVQMHGYRRDMLFADTGLPWVQPSPNMPTPETALVYPGGCLLEATTLSEGRGLTRPFEVWGAPGVPGEALAEAVRAPGVVLRPLTFMPTFHKHAGAHCGGVQVHVRAPRAVRSYGLYLRLLAAVYRLSPDAFGWRSEAYEFVTDRPAIDLLTGGPEFRCMLEGAGGDGPQDLDAYLAWEQQGAEAFAADRRVDLYY